jgi:serine/threonine-protein kinase
VCLDETTVLAFVGGRLADEGIDDHLASCRTCRDLVIAAARTTFASGSSPEPAQESREAPASGIDRYTITGLVGAGGQALVYQAHDRVLDRAIALKILRDDRGARILDEARLVAKLEHPNIVAVYDAGTTGDGQLYLAMEYASGGSLDAWLRTPREPREIVRACAEAGRGLARAHAAGIVHRDIKAANILIGADGHARVTDFGLATASADGGAKVAGTLAYMAPEQLDGEATAASDQFGLAVTVWEAIAGALPFPTGGDRAAAILAGPGAAPRAMPRHVAAALRRSFDADPGERWPSVDALVQALEADPARSRRWFALAAGGAAVMAALVVFALREATPRACASVAAPPTWNTGARARIAGAFGRSSRPFARDALASVLDGLDRYAEDWRAARQAACEATADGEQSTQALDLRDECLDDQATVLAATIDTLSTADDGVIEHAVDAVRALPSLAPCSDLARLGDRVRAPADPTVRARIAAITSDIATSTALLLAGKFPEARTAAERAATAASSLDHPPTRARALLALARVQLLFGEAKPAEENLEQAAQLAEQGRDDRAAAEAWIELVKAVGHGNARYDEALRYAGFASAAVERLGGDRALRGKLEYYRCAVLDLMARLDDADAACARGRGDREAVFGAESPEVADLLVLESRLAIKRGRIEPALAASARAVAIREHAFGASHPSLIEALFAHGQAAATAGKLDDADAAFARGVAIAKASGEDDTLIVAALLSEQAALAHARGKLTEALSDIERSSAIRERIEGHDHADLVFDETEHARILEDLGRDREAVIAYEAALATALRALGDHHPSVSAILEDLGRLHGRLGMRTRARSELDRAIAISQEAGDGPGIASSTDALAEFLHGGGQPGQALPLYQRALAQYETIYGKDAPQLIATLENLGLAEIDLHAPAAAVPYLERAIALETARSGPTSSQLLNPLTSLGDAKLALGDRSDARAVWQRALALTGLDDYPDQVRVLRTKLQQ